jgi:hypothetical protein
VKALRLLPSLRALFHRLYDPAGAYLRATAREFGMNTRRWRLRWEWPRSSASTGFTPLTWKQEKRSPRPVPEPTPRSNLLTLPVLLPFAGDEVGLRKVAARLVREGELLLTTPASEFRASLVYFRWGDAVFEAFSEGAIAGSSRTNMRIRVPRSDLRPPFTALATGLKTLAVNADWVA